MKISRVILAGIIVWVLIFVTFIAISAIPVIKNSEMQQYLIIHVLLIPFAAFGAKFYYKIEQKTNGLVIGLLMALTAIVLDAIITVPLVVIPHNGSYLSFFSNPLLWTIFIEFTLIVFFYWKLKVKSNET